VETEGDDSSDYPLDSKLEHNEIKAELGFQKPVPNQVKRYNTHLIINSEGQIVSKYRKIHLFDVDMTSKGGVIVHEGLTIQRGNKIADPIYSPCGYLGLSISFDVRFPEMYRELVLKGA
jgi:predicted amidohydrolase